MIHTNYQKYGELISFIENNNINYDYYPRNQTEQIGIALESGYDIIHKRINVSDLNNKDQMLINRLKKKMQELSLDRMSFYKTGFYGFRIEGTRRYGLYYASAIPPSKVMPT